MCSGYADKQLDYIYSAIIKAQHFVDITTLEHLPDSKFRSTIRNALTFLATTGRKITVRILDGLYEPIPTVTEKNEQIAQQYLPSSHTTSAFLVNLIRDLKNIPSSNVDIYVAGMRSQSGTANTNLSRGKYDSLKGYMSFSWNHSKIIDVDGTHVITGGVNMFSKDYLTKKPAFDLMIEIKGPAANKTLGFTNLLWNFVRNNKNDPLHVIEYSASKPHHYRVVKSDIPSNLIGDNTSPGNIKVLSIGRTGCGLYAPGIAQQHNTSDYAFYDLLSKAQRTIYIAQQSLKASFNIWPLNTTNRPHTNLMSALASLLVNKGNVYIVTSPYNTSIPLELGYESLATPKEMWDKVENEAIAMYTKIPKSTIDHALCGKLHIATIRFNQYDTTWPDGSKIYDHYKFMMVDSHIFYLGSQNFYPSGLQNYGYIIDDRGTADVIKDDFWNKLWSYSSSSEYKPSQCLA
ncbi:PLD-like domain protein [Piscirickettsiaceae bacterium NZ-RLO2]|nr:PLD-like domain protein [Piscirickettsiaceae bacterium NZ-RLO2]